MKKWVKVSCSLLLSSLVLLGAVSLLCLTSSATNTLEIYWIDDNHIGIPYDPFFDNYTVWYSLDYGGEWYVLTRFSNDDFDLARQDYYSVLVPLQGWRTYYVSAENATNPADLYQSNVLEAAQALFSLRSADYFLEWDNVPNVAAYEVQYISGSGAIWTTYHVLSRAETYFAPPSNLAGLRFRIRARLFDGSYWFSNTVIWNYGGDVTYDIGVVTSNPFPVITEPDWTITVYPEQTVTQGDIIKANQILTAGIYNSKLWPYVSLAFGFLASFAMVGYFAFRMH